MSIPDGGLVSPIMLTFLPIFRGQRASNLSRRLAIGNSRSTGALSLG